jgi:hypothetical protein
MWRSELMLQNVPECDVTKYRAARPRASPVVWLGEAPEDETAPLLKSVPQIVTINFNVDLRDDVCKKKIEEEWMKKKLEAPYVDMGESAPQGLCHMLVESGGEPKSDSIQLPHQDFGVMYGTKMVRMHPTVNKGMGALFDYDTGTGKSIVMARIIYELTHETTVSSNCSECVVFWPDTKEKFKDELTKVMHSNDLSKGLLGTKWTEVPLKDDYKLTAVPSSLHDEIIKSTKPNVSINPTKLGSLKFTIDSVVMIKGRYYKPKPSTQYNSAKVPNLMVNGRNKDRNFFKWSQDIRQLANSNDVQNIVDFYEICRAAYDECVNVKFPESRAARPYLILIDEAQFYLEDTPDDVATKVAATLDSKFPKAKRASFDPDDMKHVASKASCLKHFMDKLQEANYKTFLYLFSATVNMGSDTDPMFANLQKLPFDDVPTNKFHGKAFHTLTYSEMAATLRPYVRMNEIKMPTTFKHLITPTSRCVFLIGENTEREIDNLLTQSNFTNKTPDIESRLDAIKKDPDTELSKLRAFLLDSKREDEVTYAFATREDLLGPTVDIYGKSGRRYPPTPINIIILGKKCDGVSLGNTTLGFYFHPPTDAGDFKQKASRAIRLCSIDPEENPLPTFQLNIILNDDRRKEMYGEWTPDNLKGCITERLENLKKPLDMLLYSNRTISKPLQPNILPEFVGSTDTFVASAPLLNFSSKDNPKVCIGFLGKRLYKCVMDKSRKFAVLSHLHRKFFGIKKITFDFDGTIAEPEFPLLQQPNPESVPLGAHPGRRKAVFQKWRFKKFTDYFQSVGPKWQYRTIANGVFARRVWVLGEYSFGRYSKEWLLTDYTLNHLFDFGEDFTPTDSVVWIGSQNDEGGFKTYDFHGAIKYSSELNDDALITLPTFTVPTQQSEFPVLGEGQACEIGYETNVVYLNFGRPDENGWYMVEWINDSNISELEQMEMSLKTEYLQAKYPSIPDLRVVPNSTVFKSMVFKNAQEVKRVGDRAVYNLIFHQPTTTEQPTIVTRYGVTGEIVTLPDEHASQLAFNVEGYANSGKLFVLISEEPDLYFQFNNVVYPLQKTTKTQQVYYSTTKPDDEDAIILQKSDNMTTDLFGFFYLSDNDAEIKLFDERNITLFKAEPVDKLEACVVPWTYHFHRYVRMYMKQKLMKDLLPLSHIQNILRARTTCLNMFLRHSGKKYIPNNLTDSKGVSSLDLIDFETMMLKRGQMFKSLVVPKLFTKDTHDDLISSQLMRMLLIAGGYGYANLNEDFVSLLEERPTLIYDNFITVRKQAGTVKQTLAEMTAVDGHNPLPVPEEQYVAAFELDTKVDVLKRVNLLVKAHMRADNRLLEIFHESVFRFMIIPTQATEKMQPTVEFYNKAFDLSLKQQPGTVLPSDVTASILSKDAYEPSKTVALIHPIRFTQNQNLQLYHLRYYVVNKISSALLSGKFGTKESTRIGNTPMQCTLSGQYSEVRRKLNERVKILKETCNDRPGIVFLKLKDLPPLGTEFTTPYELGLLFVALIAQLAACDVSDLWNFENQPELKTLVCTKLYDIARKLTTTKSTSCIQVANMFAPPNVDLDILDKLYNVMSKNKLAQDCRRMLIVALKRLISLFNKARPEDYVDELYNDEDIREDFKKFQREVEKPIKIRTTTARTFTTTVDVELPDGDADADMADQPTESDATEEAPAPSGTVEYADMADRPIEGAPAPSTNALRKRKVRPAASSAAASSAAAPIRPGKRSAESEPEDERQKRQSTGPNQLDDDDMAP